MLPGSWAIPKTLLGKSVLSKPLVQRHNSLRWNHKSTKVGAGGVLPCWEAWEDLKGEVLQNMPDIIGQEGGVSGAAWSTGIGTCAGNCTNSTVTYASLDFYISTYLQTSTDTSVSGTRCRNAFVTEMPADTEESLLAPEERYYSSASQGYTFFLALSWELSPVQSMGSTAGRVEEPFDPQP